MRPIIYTQNITRSQKHQPFLRHLAHKSLLLNLGNFLEVKVILVHTLLLKAHEVSVHLGIRAGTLFIVAHCQIVDVNKHGRYHSQLTFSLGWKIGILGQVPIETVLVSLLDSLIMPMRQLPLLVLPFVL